MDKWRACRCPGMTITDFADWEAFVGVDMATKKDLAAVSILFEKDGMFAVFPDIFFAGRARAGPEPSKLPALSGMGRGGFIDAH